MPCRICGSPCQGDRCAGCEQIAANEARHGVPADHYDDEGDGNDGTDQDDSDGDEWTVEQQSLDGGTHEGQATLSGGVAREVER